MYTVDYWDSNEGVQKTRPATAEETQEINARKSAVKPVPEVVSPRQIRQALTQKGLRAAVEFAISNSDQDMKDWWEFAIEFNRNHPVVLAMASQLNVSDAQVDDLFRLAGTL